MRVRSDVGRSAVEWFGTATAVALWLALVAGACPASDCEPVNPTSVPAVEAHRCRPGEATK